MKAITIKQPWASLIAAGLKDIENRSWKTNYRGRVLIHAAAAPVKEGLAALNNKQLFELMNRENWETEFDNLPNATIVGSVEIVDCVQNHPSKWAQEGFWHWVLANPEMYPEPITGVKGKLSFWDYDGELPQPKDNQSTTERQPKYNRKYNTDTETDTDTEIFNNSNQRLESEKPTAFSPANLEVPAPVPQPTVAELREQTFRKNVSDSTQKMLERLTVKEQMQVSFIPLIITQCAWVYAHKSMALAARDKISILKKLSRTLKMVHQHYEDDLRRDLDYKSRTRIQTQAEEFMQSISHDMLILYFTVRQEILRCAPEYPCVEQRAYAIMSLLFIDLLETHNKEMDKLLAEKLDDCNLAPNVMHPMTKHLRTGMTAFAGVEGKFNYDNFNVKLAIKVVGKRLNAMEFNVTGE